MSKAEDFATQFNQLMVKSGKTARNPATDQNAADIAKINLALAIPARRKGSSVSAGKAATAKKAVSTASDLTKSELFRQILQQQTADTGHNDSSLLSNVGHGFEWLVTKPLEQLARIPHATFGALTETAKAFNKGEGLGAVDNLLGGLYKGAVDNKQYGMGDLYSQLTAKPLDKQSNWMKGVFSGLDAIAQGSNAVEKWAGDYKAKPFESVPSWLLPDSVEHWQFKPGAIPRYATNLAGEIVLDPTTYVGGGVTRTIGDSAAKDIWAKAGEELAAKGYKGPEEIAKLSGEEAYHLVTQYAGGEALKASPLASAEGYAGKAEEWDKAPENVLNAARDSAERQVTEISKGGMGGKMVSKDIPGQLAEQAAASTAAFHEEMQRPLRSIVDRMASEKGLTEAEIAHLAESSPEARKVIGAYQEGKGLEPAERLQRAYKTAAEITEADAEKFHGNFLSAAEDKLKNIPTVKLAGREIAQLPKLGAAFKAATSPLARSDTIKNLRKAFSFSANAPGQMEQAISKAANHGVVSFENEIATAKRVFKELGLKDEDLTTIQTAINRGEELTGNLGEAQKYFKDLRSEMHIRESGEGLASDAKHPWVQVRGGTAKRRTEFYEARKKAIAAYEKTGVPLPDFAEVAKDMGLKPETNPFANHIYRRLKSEHDLTKQYLDRDMFGMYGIKGRYSPQTARAMGLAEVPKTGRMADLVKTMTKDFAPGEKMYLHQDIMDALKKYHQIGVNLSSDEEKQLFRSWDYITNKWKVLNTIYSPGFHVRNFMSDLFIGNMDGVGLKDYKRAFDGYIRRNTAKIRIGSEEVPYNEFFDGFKSSAGSGGYFESEFGEAIRGSKGHPGQRFTSTIKSKANEREELGRFAHYIHAMDEETANLERRGYSHATAMEKAKTAALYRVNKYKFNYSALTNIERRYIRRAVPFYTFLRKATPLVMESAALTPRNLVGFEKFRESMNSGNDQSFVPQWMREMGYGAIGNTGWGATDEWFPGQIVGSAISNPAAKLNPLLQIPIEASTGKTLFSHTSLGSDNFLKNLFTSGELYKSKLNMWGKADILRGASKSKAPGAEQLANFFGIPVRKLTENRQNQSAKTLQVALEDKLQQTNDTTLKNSGLHAYWSNGKSPGIKVAKDEDGSVVSTYSSYEEFLKAVGK